jgi:formylglycine-generating enzyme required for sulfatase activity
MSSRVLRGGSWPSDGNFIRVPNRNRFHPYYRYDHVGFRISRVISK